MGRMSFFGLVIGLSRRLSLVVNARDENGLWRCLLRNWVPPPAATHPSPKSVRRRARIMRIPYVEAPAVCNYVVVRRGLLFFLPSRILQSPSISTDRVSSGVTIHKSPSSFLFLVDAHALAKTKKIK